MADRLGNKDGLSYRGGDSLSKLLERVGVSL